MPDYTSVGTVKGALGITNTGQDAGIGLAISAASRLIDKWCRRTFGAGVQASRTFVADSAYYVAIDDLSSATGLVVETRSSVSSAWTTVASSAYQVEPLNGLRDGVPWALTAIRAVGVGFFPTYNKDALIRVSGLFGWPSVPQEIEQACLIQACRLLKRPESAMGVLGVSDVGAITVTKGLDTDVALLIEDYRRIGGI